MHGFLKICITVQNTLKIFTLCTIKKSNQGIISLVTSRQRQGGIQDYYDMAHL